MKERWYFLRGLVRESEHWNGFPDHFLATFPEVEIIQLDLPGTGKRFSELSPNTIAKAVAELRNEFIQDPHTQSHLFAVSLGGMIGFEWLKLFPNDFFSAVFVNTSLRGLSPLFDRLLPRNYWSILRIGISNKLANREQKILEMTSNRPDLVHRFLPDWVEIQKQHPVSNRSAIRQLAAAARYLAPENPPACKLLLLNSRSDQLVAPVCSEAIANTYSVPIQHHDFAGHDLTLDAPEWVLDKVAEFRKK